MKRGRVVVAAAIALAVGASVALAESTWVKSDSVDIRGGKGAVFPVLGVAKKGQELTVLSRDGKWIQVQAGAATGWVFEGGLSPQKVNGDLIAITPGNAAEMGTGIAARGLQPSAETYVANGRLNKAPLERLIALRKSIPPAEWEAFTAQVRAGTRP